MNQANTITSEANIEAPVIIIGAGRSGTNMLRDLLVQLPQFATWPCDEINYIWRHGNKSFGTDEFTRAMATESVKKFIRDQFQSIQSKNPASTIVEKTCANSLRCGFLHEIFPKAKFVHIIRDGRDVAASAALRWNAKLDLGYILKKARFVPLSDVPFYASKYLMARVFRLTSGKSRLSTWGPKFEGMQSAFRDYELPVACALQWKRCVEAAVQQLGEIDPMQVKTVRYEEMTSHPSEVFAQICSFLGAVVPEEDLSALTAGVSGKSVGKWKSSLSEKQLQQIEELAGALLRDLQYL